MAAVEGVADGRDDVGGAHGAGAPLAGRRLAVVAAVQQEYLGRAASRYALPHALRTHENPVVTGFAGPTCGAPP